MSFLDFSDEDLQNEEKRSERMLQATKIHHFPLVSARSIAHSNKLNVLSNDIYVSLLENDVSTLPLFIFFYIGLVLLINYNFYKRKVCLFYRLETVQII